MSSSNKDSWVQYLRQLICTNHGRGELKLFTLLTRAKGLQIIVLQRQ